jgi:hypothetical protein
VADWDLNTLRDLDARYAREGVHMHQRPFRAAMDVLGPDFRIGGGGNPDVQRIQEAYAAMLPEADATWPGMGVGLAASLDRVRQVVLPVPFGEARIEVWETLGFQDQAAWWLWCREDRTVAAGTHFAVADLSDFFYGLSELEGPDAEAVTLWRMAGSNLGEIATALPTLFDVASIVQPICLVAELSLKALLVSSGTDPKGLRGPKGHDIVGLVDAAGRVRPHRDDALVGAVARKLPPYVASRYRPAGLTKLEVVRLALGAQFIAASTMRRVSARDLAAQMETGGWPAPRPSLFASEAAFEPSI